MASFNTGIRTGAFPLATTSLNTGTAPQTNEGTTVPIVDVEVGTLSALVAVSAKVNTMTVEPQWRVSADGSTWYSVKASNNAAAVVMATGTGSAVTATLVISAPDGVYGWQYANCAVISRVAAAADSNDSYSVSYNYMKRGFAR